MKIAKLENPHLILKNWGFKMPEDFEGVFLNHKHKKKLLQWVENFSNESYNLLFPEVNSKTLEIIYVMAHKLLSLNKIKSHIALTDINEILSPSFEERKIAEERIHESAIYSDLIVLEDFDFLKQETPIRVQAQWVVKTRLKNDKPMMILLAGDINNLIDLVGATTLSKLTSNALVVE